jgi:hypothetical protein
MQKIRRKYEGNRLFDCHVRGTICSLNEKRPWLNGITPEGEVCFYAYPPAERVILSRRRRISVHGDSETLVDKYKSVGRFRRFRRFRGWWYRPGAMSLGCLGGLLCFEYLFDSFPPAPFRTYPTADSVGRQKDSAPMGSLGALLRPTCVSYAEHPQSLS